jgi:hypothetical protein
MIRSKPKPAPVHLNAMRAESRERLSQLCRQAAVEDNPEKLKLINREMDRLLLDEEHELRRQKPDSTVA